MVNAAQIKLQALIQEIRSQSPPTLAFWRLSNPRMLEALQSFAAAAGTPSASNDAATSPAEPSLLLLQVEETQALFDTINPILAQQENVSPAFCQHFKRAGGPSSITASSSSPSLAVVFGGKYSPTPRSISELLVSKLAKTCPRVVTVSRTPLEKLLADSGLSALPDNVTHISKQQLDHQDEEIGIQEFSDVIQLALLDWKTGTSSKPTTMTTPPAGNGDFVIYFTLGQHKGENPFVRNLQAAHNFAQALLEPKNASILHATANCKKQSWRVVVTGTDATLPSTHPDGSIDGLLQQPIDDEGTTTSTTSTTCTVPTYKIMKYNYTYAMSKLGQYYIIASATAQITASNNNNNNNNNNNDQHQQLVEKECGSIIEKIQRHVRAAGEDGDYHSDDDQEATMTVSMSELDDISTKVDSLLLLMQHQEDDDDDNNHHRRNRHFTIAQGISICYTPLHARPWTEQAWESSSLSSALSSPPPNTTDEDGYFAQKAFILEQIFKRFKNAISIEQAVTSHFQS